MEEIFDGDVAMAGSADLIPVPSGQPVVLQDVVWNVTGSQGFTLRFRFVAPEIRAGGTVDFDTAVADMQVLCADFARARVTDFGGAPQQIIISMAEKPVVFGETLPDVVQFFEAFRIEGDTCIWEIY
jgi:Family of unknown function (DUF6497)